MAYGKMRVKPITKFGEWLNMQMSTHDMGGKEIASKLHWVYATVYNHRSGSLSPTFTDVVAYCWVFGCNEDPESIWAMVDIPIEEN